MIDYQIKQLDIIQSYLNDIKKIANAVSERPLDYPANIKLIAMVKVTMKEYLIACIKLYQSILADNRIDCTLFEIPFEVAIEILDVVDSPTEKSFAYEKLYNHVIFKEGSLVLNRSPGVLDKVLNYENRIYGAEKSESINRNMNIDIILGWHYWLSIVQFYVDSGNETRASEIFKEILDNCNKKMLNDPDIMFMNECKKNNWIIPNNDMVKRLIKRNKICNIELINAARKAFPNLFKKGMNLILFIMTT